MKCCTLLVVIALLGAGSVPGQAQDGGRVVGVVTSEGGRPISGASISVAGTALGTLTGTDGRYGIDGVPAGPREVRTSMLGYADVTREVVVDVGGSVTADFQMSTEAILLEGIVAVGYGTQERRTVTGSVASIRSEEINRIVTANPMDALKGRLAGVDISSMSFEPGAAARVRIRGSRSIQASNDPLIVVNGVPIGSSDPTNRGMIGSGMQGLERGRNSGSGGLRDINPQDIESIEVLKDAAATAIYGSRAANGVLLITTKQGSAGRTRIDYNMSIGAQRILRMPDMMNGEQFANYRREAYRAAENEACQNYLVDPATCDAGGALDAFERENLNAGIWTDWQDELLRTGDIQSHQLAISGGTDNTQFRASASYLDQTGITRTQAYDAKSAMVSLTHDFGRVDVHATVQGSQTVRHAGRGAGVWDEALFNSPLGRARDDEGNLIMLPTEDGIRVNPLADALNNQRDIDRKQIIGTMNAALEIADGVRFNTNFGPQYAEIEDGYFVGTDTRSHRGAGPPDAGLHNTRRTTYTLSNYLDIDRQFGAHRLQGTFLYEVSRNETKTDNQTATELPYSHQRWYDLGSGKNFAIQSGFSESELQSFMGRVNYTLNDRYTFNFAGRVDGSSVLAEGNKYSFFPSASFAWRIGDEAFMQNVSVFSDLKLRAGFGRKGNSAIGPYQTLGTLNNAWYNFGASDPQVLGFQPGNIPNPELEWEKTDEYNVGLDFGLLGNRITGSFDAYLQQTEDLLLPRAVPYTSGFSTVLENVGETENKGIELAISTLNFDNWHGLEWSTELSFALNRNKIKALASGLQQDIGSGWFVGEPVAVNFNHEFLGIWQEDEAELADAMCGCRPGQIKVADVDGNGVIDGNDRTFIGNHVDFPSWTGSLFNQFRYRNLDLSVLATARWGYTVNNGFIAGYSNLAGRFNNLNVNYWTPEDPSNEFPRPVRDAADRFLAALAFQDGSHVRIRDITLGYTLPQPMLDQIGVQRARLYVRAQDPFLFTKRDFVGWDPEGGFGSGNGNFTESQVDMGSPSYRSFLFGLDVTF